MIKKRYKQKKGGLWMLWRLLAISLCALVLGACAASEEPPQSGPEPPEASSEPAGAPEPVRYPRQIKPEQAVFTAQPLPAQVREQITGVSWVENPHISLDELSLLTLSYCDFEGEAWLGQMIVAADVAQDLTEIFRELFEQRFPIEKMQLIEAYEADDNRSMADNNSSAFCYRVIDGTEYLSNHSFGRAVDINPLQNPYVRGELVQPDAAAEYMDRENVRPGMIVRGDICYNAFISRGWEWGGDWTGPIDYQHFEKPEE